ncbi:hypothetical protein JUNP479_3240 [Aeromonas jandaei]|nr:hypothetical protein JUNP479_3240 [Aeromonas jandaei]
MADRTLADVQFKGGAGEAEQPGHHLEILHRTQGRKFHYLNISWVVIFYHFTGYQPARYPPPHLKWEVV